MEEEERRGRVGEGVLCGALGKGSLSGRIRAGAVKKKRKKEEEEECRPGLAGMKWDAVWVVMGLVAVVLVSAGQHGPGHPGVRAAILEHKEERGLNIRQEADQNPMPSRVSCHTGASWPIIGCS